MIKRITVIFIATLLASCASVRSIPPSPTAENTITPVIHPSPTPTISPPTSMPTALEKSNFVCVPNKSIEGWETSPNEKWMTAGFYTDEKGNSLEVVSLDCLKKWTIYLSDFKEQDDNGSHDGIIPYYWSMDGKYLYAVVGSRIEGCCWQGLRYVLLIRLDLETGKQINILSTGSNTGYHFDFTISDNDRYIIFTPPQGQSYDFAVLNLVTWETQEYTIGFSETIDVVYAVMSSNGDQIVIPLFKNIEYDEYFINSIALVDLATGKQKLLVSDFTQEKQLYPVRWLDESHVLLSNVDPKFKQDNQPLVEYWSLDTVTRKIEKHSNP